jgi:hypothetical protein
MEHNVRGKIIIAFKYLIKKTQQGCCDNLNEKEIQEILWLYLIVNKRKKAVMCR